MNIFKLPIPLLALVLILLGSCGTLKKRKEDPAQKFAPQGMVYVPPGTVLVGQSDDKDTSEMKRVSLSGFFIDKGTVTNRQYRSFVNWVRDSIAVTDFLKNDKRYFLRKRRNDKSLAQIDWKKVSAGKGLFTKSNQKVLERLEAMFDTVFAGQRRVNPELLNYTFQEKVLNPKGTKPAYITRTDKINIYPDEAVWDKDFAYSQNHVMAQTYFTDKEYDDYPVVGITWKQARAYANWKTKQWATPRKCQKNKRMVRMPLDLPTEAQWAYAAEGVAGRPVLLSLSRKEKRQIAFDTTKTNKNFKQAEGVYAQDGATYPSPSVSFAPNNFGVYNITGNVSQWTLNQYTESWAAFVHDLNPILSFDARDTDSETMKKKVIRGGSWKDSGKELSVRERSSELQDVSHSYIGFRCVMPAPEYINARRFKKRTLR